MEDKGKESTYNEASLKMLRINNAWEIINTLRVNLLAWNKGCNKWNYKVVISYLYSLWQEVRSKCTMDEKKEYVKKRNLITSWLELKPIHDKKAYYGFRDREFKLEFSFGNWVILRNLIDDLEDYIRDMHEEHGLSTPNAETEELWN